MHEPSSTAMTPSTRWLRRAALLLCCAGTIGGLACATMLTADSHSRYKSRYYNTPVLTDTIYALGLPDAALAKKIGHDNAVAFLGRKNTYLLIDGGDKLTSVSTGFDGERMTLSNQARGLYLKDKTLWGNVVLRYTAPTNTPQGAQEVRRLLALGFQKERYPKDTYTFTIPVKGAVYPPANVASEQSQQFKKTREVSFYPPPDSHPPPDVGILIEMPLAIAVDVAATPLYVVGLVIVAISMN